MEASGAALAKRKLSVHAFKLALIVHALSDYYIRMTLA